MGIFKRNYNKPGPGVPKDAPRKKGIPRFFEVLGRDFSNLVKLNLLYQLCVLPAQLSFVLMIWKGPLFAILLVAASVLVGPANTARSYCITKMLRDDPGFLWHDFKRKFIENFKSTTVVGVLYSLILAAQVYSILGYAAAGSAIPLPTVVLLLLSALLFSMVAPYYFLQAAYLDTNQLGLFKNSVLLAFGYLPRSFMGAVIGLAFWVVFLQYAYIAVVPVVFFGYTIPVLISLMWTWPVVNKTFSIEETLVKRQQDELDRGSEG